MNLKGRFKVVKVKKKTSAQFFKELKVGDEFELSYNMSGRYESAPTIFIYKDGKSVHTNSALQLNNNLDKFEIEQIG